MEYVILFCHCAEPLCPTIVNSHGGFNRTVRAVRKNQMPSVVLHFRSSKKWRGDRKPPFISGNEVRPVSDLADQVLHYRERFNILGVSPSQSLFELFMWLGVIFVTASSYRFPLCFSAVFIPRTSHCLRIAYPLHFRRSGRKTWLVASRIFPAQTCLRTNPLTFLITTSSSS